MTVIVGLTVLVFVASIVLTAVIVTLLGDLPRHYRGWLARARRLR